MANNKWQIFEEMVEMTPENMKTLLNSSDEFKPGSGAVFVLLNADLSRFALPADSDSPSNLTADQVEALNKIIDSVKNESENN